MDLLPVTAPSKLFAVGEPVRGFDHLWVVGPDVPYGSGWDLEIESVDDATDTVMLRVLRGGQGGPQWFNPGQSYRLRRGHGDTFQPDSDTPYWYELYRLDGQLVWKHYR